MRVFAAIMVFMCCGLAPVPAAAQSFPVEIEHRYGTAVIPTEPQRVVSLSYIGHDFLLALGVRPVGLRYWYGPHPFGVWPWAQEALGDAEPVVMQGEINIERVAMLKPDLIVGLWSGMTEGDYNLLSKIAPTVAPEARYGLYDTPWQQMTRTLGRATGRYSRADAIVTRIENRFADLRQAHPDWQGKTAVVVWAGNTGAYTKNDIRAHFMKALGFDAPKAVNALGTPDQYYVTIAEEDLSPIDADVLIWVDAGRSTEQVAAMPLRHTMRAYTQGREVYADFTLAAALSHSSPLSIDYALDQLVPLLEAAVDGDPTSVVQSTHDVGLAPQVRHD